MRLTKTVIKIIALQLFVAVFCFTGIASAQEKINNFESTIEVQKSGEILVTEKIEYDFDFNYKHGIFRTIPLRTAYNIENAKKFLKIDVMSVKDEQGNSYNFTDKGGDILNIKIGDPDVTITGVKTYIISYKVSNALGHFADFDEIYWNATGNEWLVDIDKSKVEVIFPEDVQPIAGRVHCYYGYAGYKNSCENVVQENNKIVFSTLRSLNSNEGITIAVGFPKGIFPEYVYKPKWYQKEDFYYNLSKILAVGFLLYLIYRIFFVYVPYINKHKKPIVVEHNAPLGMTASEAGIIRYLGLTSRINNFISGDILYLATNGYIKIETRPDLEQKKLLGKLSARISFFGKKFLNYKDEIVFTRTGKNIENEKDHIKKLYNLLTNETGPKTAKDAYKECDSVWINEYVMGTSEFYSGVVHCESSVKESNITTFIFKRLALVLPLVLISISGFAISSAEQGVKFLPLLVISGFLALNLVVEMVCGHFVMQTMDSYYKVTGLYRYISIAEKDRLAFENDPQNLPRIFSELLPFAVAFGLGKKWVSAFDGLIKTNPEWYHSQDSFSTAVFYQGISNISSSVVPVSSSSSGGSSGGGSSGGGGGGGGGGSW